MYIGNDFQLEQNASGDTHLELVRHAHTDTRESEQLKLPVDAEQEVLRYDDQQITFDLEVEPFKWLRPHLLHVIGRHFVDVQPVGELHRQAADSARSGNVLSHFANTVARTSIKSITDLCKWLFS